MLTCPSCGRANPTEASFCMGCATPLAATATAHETRKTVTALFCDLVGSTTLGERHDPEVLRPLLDRYFAAMREAVERHGGRVEKYIGDAVSAVFGLPVSHEDDALRAVRAGVEMQGRLASLNEGSAIPLAARVGITTGEVLVPGGGAPLIGDAMNTAARLQSSAEPGSVVIGEPTWRLVRDAVAAEPVEPLQVKGKAAPVGAYHVVRVASGSPMRTRRLDAPMVGRRREASLLADAFERSASDRACVLFTVLGSAGAGKSRLVEEFLASHADGEAEILRGRCLAYGEGITWYPVTEALRGALGLAEFADADLIRSAIREAVAGEEHAPALEANLAPLFAVGPGGTAEEIAWAIRRFLESRGREGTLVLVLDDVHWGEPAFLDLVEHLADWSRDAAILLLCMARPDLLDVRPAWGGGKTNAATISLAPLSGAETDALIDGLLGSSALPTEVRARITQVAEGNPLFVEEMLRMLVDDGRLVRDDEGWVAAGDLADVAVPPTVSALLSARLDRLSEGERAVVEAASVAGKEFHRGSVAALLPEAARADLAVHLRSLTRKELVTPERSSLPGEDAYRFRHLLIRDAAYDAVPKRARSELHRAFADWLEGVAGDRIAEQQELLGYHLERAYRYRVDLGLSEDRELRLRAAGALGAAGERTLDAGDVRAAIELLRTAAELAEGDRVQLPLLTHLGEALGDAGDPAALHDALLTFEHLERVAAAFGDAAYGACARAEAFRCRVRRDPASWDLDLSRELGRENLRACREQGAEDLLPFAFAFLWTTEVAIGNNAGGLPYALESLRLAQAQGRRRSTREALNLVMTTLEYGATPLSVVLERADENVKGDEGDRLARASALFDRAWVNAWMGRTREAAADLAACRSIDAELMRPSGEPFFKIVEGYAAWLDQGPVVAGPLFASAHLAIRNSGELLSTDFSGVPLARVLLELGRNGDAARVVADLRDNVGIIEPQIQARTMDAVLAAHDGDLVTAMLLSGEAEALAAPTDCLIDQGDVALDRAGILLIAGRPDEARAAADDALERFERKEYAIGIRRATAFLAALSG